MQTNMRSFGMSALITTFVIGISLVGSAAAQIVVQSGLAGSGVSAPLLQTCPTGIVKNLSRGSRGNGVVALQQMLSTAGFFNAQASGYFGPVTFGAVVAFQQAHGLPATGFFGLLTRAAITKDCQSTTPPISKVNFSADPTSGSAPLSVSFTARGVTGGSQYIIEYGDGKNSGPLTASGASCPPDPGMGMPCIIGGISARHTYTANGTYTATIEGYLACMWSNPRCMIATIPLGSVTIVVGSNSGAPVISSITPTSGAIGTSVTLRGSGFAQNQILRFGEGSVPHTTSSDGTKITFVVPQSVGPYCGPGMMCPMFVRQPTPGDYKVFVQSADGTLVSNSVTFTITDGTGGGGLSIVGLDAPTTLAMGVSGTWTVHVNSSSANANLHYSVVWGDEAQMGSSIMAPQPSTVQTSATFTHAYAHSGTYTPMFTVTDDTGHSVSTSATVTITPWY